ncbi:MAG: tRNA (N6-isopentenyl adenosine(37)-C2)-methylthiotransferase MiaB [Nitrospira sp.]|nr:tRNA (N6-isopentenyl adenosine(37)-C2)-methylthiotransferase MiaB [bacterium]MBL7050169.1 tRNA (N6-isopentenyl adenosine(37)-C2)-methylthiotransferase MiaB [Nitrospira sp.]
MTKKYHIHTFGCQMNVHDSEKISGILGKQGLVEIKGSKGADLIVLNTCSIREKAEHKFYSELGRLNKVKKSRPELKIAVAGCIAQQRGKALYKQFPYIDFIMGPDNIDKIEDWVKGIDEESDKPQLIMPKLKRTTAIEHNPDYHHLTLPMNRAGGVSAWVSIMYGCDNFCAYCVVPFTRGRERSRAGADIYNEVKDLVAQGYKEVTLLGQNVNSYGRKGDGEMDFPDLLKSIHDIEGLERIRFVTSHPRDFSEKLVDIMIDLPKVCRHIHLPIQSGSDHVLGLMNRGYTLNDYREKIEYLRSRINDIAVTSDIITGFPGESEEDHQVTMAMLAEFKFDRIFAFKYSKRPGTKALELSDHLDEVVKSRRHSEILELQEDIMEKKNSVLESEILEVMVEGPSASDSGKMTGRTVTDKIVNFNGSPSDIGKLLLLRITKVRQHSLDAERTDLSVIEEEFA